MSAGVVTAVASDPTGFGPDYPVIRVTSGALAGHYIYYGHVAASLVQVGQRVSAGQPIAVMGHTGDAASLGHGHIEIGFSDAIGNPLNHPGSTATASGAAMRSFLIGLSGAFEIHNSCPGNEVVILLSKVSASPRVPLRSGRDIDPMTNRAPDTRSQRPKRASSHVDHGQARHE
jgi:murein DD-endopeptidase MepM/ murein hydrolase activator NlpD